MHNPFEALSAELKALQEHQDREYQRMMQRLDGYVRDFKQEIADVQDGEKTV